MDKRTLERRLAALDGLSDPDLSLEQYPTPPDIAAHLLTVAALRGDIFEKVVLDLGTGAGVLALGAALLESATVIGLDRDQTALEVARRNGKRLDPPVHPEWIHADAGRLPIQSPSVGPVTVVMNPPFGAQDGNEGADRRFLAATAEVATVSYSLHNTGSRGFVETFASDAGGEVTDAFEVELALDRRFEHHTSEREELAAELYRIEWNPTEHS